MKKNKRKHKISHNSVFFNRLKEGEDIRATNVYDALINTITTLQQKTGLWIDVIKIIGNINGIAFYYIYTLGRYFYYVKPCTDRLFLECEVQLSIPQYKIRWDKIQKGGECYQGWKIVENTEWQKQEHWVI